MKQAKSQSGGVGVEVASHWDETRSQVANSQMVFMET